MSFNLEDSIDTIFTISVVTVRYTYERNSYIYSKDVVIIFKFHNDYDLFKKI